MRGIAEFAFAQARLQARHGERLTEADWRALEGAHSLGRYLEHARATALKRFVARIGADMDAHEIERELRAQARDYVDEVAAWAPQRWRAAIGWLRALPDAPLVDGLRQGAPARGWMGADPTLAAWRDGEAATARSPAAPPGDWRALWPKEKARCATLARLAGQARDLAPTAGQAEGRPALERALTRAIRAHAATPAALVGHIGLVFVDLERLRGGLSRRALFSTRDRSVAA